MRLQGTVFRAHNPKWAFSPVSGDGAALYGGRFNPRGVPALYTSLRMETAWREAQQGFAFKAQPLTICAYDVDCAEVADLTDARVRADLGIDESELSCPWEELVLQGVEPGSWMVARRLLGTGTAAIIVPSFAPGAITRDRNVVFWRWGPNLPYRVLVVDDEGRLPRDQRSWS
ncbi:RES family NAD+ phosphorylase [Plastoroseomonas hellenica]|uniref:RES family NAD+ phosphorylase n=1 Tax=Plastoroseomonas hellenica TaxID=2687306 RepID=UPI001BA5ABD1|nr:RES domain-containing protein [Plastoroseomonas hellenica]